MLPAVPKPPGSEGQHKYVPPSSVPPGEPSGYVPCDREPDPEPVPTKDSEV